MKKLGLLTVALATVMGLGACNQPAPGPEPGPKYTVESAINLVCDKLNTVFELEGEDKITPEKEDDDTYYIVMNLGDVDPEQLMTFVDANLLVEDFTPKQATWAQEEDEGIVFNFKDCPTRCFET